MSMGAVLERFIAHSPMAVTVRGAFEYALDAAHLDALFVRTVGHRDDRELLFSTCVDLMAAVVCRVKPSIHAAYQAQDHIPVNVTAVYARLARFGIAGRGGSFVIRRHAATLSWERETEWVPAGRTDTGTLDEQTIWLTEPDGAELAVRRVRVTLDIPTRDGDRVIEVLTNVPAEAATAARVAVLYRDRWSVEGLFLRLTTVLRCEVNTLGYPPAALFGFCVALAAGNVYAAVKGALCAAHGPAVADRVSDYHLALEVSGACPGLEIAIPAETWAEVGGWSVERMAQWLGGLARRANLRRYRKATRGPKKPKTPRTRFPDAKHIATSRLLNGEQTRCVKRDGHAQPPFQFVVVDVTARVPRRSVGSFSSLGSEEMYPSDSSSTTLTV